MIERFFAFVSLLMARIGGALLLGAAILIGTEVILRYSRLGAFSLGTELSSYALAVGASWALAYVVFERGHVRIDVLPQRLPARAKAVLDILGLASLAGIGFVLSAGALEMFQTSWGLSARANTPLGTPLVIPQGAWTAGLFWFTAIAAWRTGRAFVAMIAADFARVDTIAGSPGTEEEVEEAISETQQWLGKSPDRADDRGTV
ncbi:TRAP transporter small permease [Fodinicurvata sp. EGI_FJ10296]|uniref:TRAP transporter small permease subunit n=1 Tax=Fodinicurvata sp. EGI_FJ10296 TaxID=3231908 RepID=UPI0034535E5F